ncbi:MAG: hypothetical protein J6B87_07315 [Clostridia bacterium]|nr:hypothetical protein [Clostridia bacterium]
MTKKRLILILTIITILLCIGTVNATEVTMRVDSKHIVGLDSCINVVYVISERQMNSGPDKYIVQEYPVSIQDYSKIQIGQTVTLEIPDSRLDACKVVKIE